MASSPPAGGPNQWQGAVFSSQDDSGITGMLGRHIELPRSAFKRILEAATQKEMKATLEHKAPKNLSIIGLPMISPDSLFAMMWISFIAIMDMTYTAYWVPINVAFCSTSYGDLSSNCTAADLAGGIVYALHLFLSFHIGTVMFHGYRKKLIMDGCLVARIYIRHGRFLLDLVSVLPFFYLVIIIAGDYVSIRWVAIVSLFRLIRMGRLLSIGNIILTDIKRGDKNSPVARFFGGSTPAYLFIIGFFATTIINMEGCLMVLVSNFIGKENSWMTSLDWIDIPNASSLYHWYYGIYTAIASNTSTGIFGMQLLHPGEFAVGLFLQCVGILMFTFVATVGLSAVTRASASAMAMYRLREKLKRVNDWLSRRNVPKGLKAEILAHYHGPWMARKQAVRGDEVVAGMPRHLRDLLLQPVTHSLTSSVHFFGGLGTNVRSLVAQNLVPFEVSKGVELCREGEAARCCWVMESGTMLACNMKGDVHKLYAPCLFGESLFLGQDVHACRRRLWMYRSAEPCRLWRLSGSDVSMLIHLTPDIQKGLMEYVQSKLIHALSHALKPSEGSSNPLSSPTPSGRGFEAAFSCGPAGGDASGLDDHAHKSFNASSRLGASSSSMQGQPSFGSADGHWCELVAAVMETLVQQPPHIQADVLQQLIKADSEDGSLQRLLDALLAVSTLNKKAAAVLGEELPNPEKVLFARAARSETPRSERTRRTSWQTSTAELPKHSVTGPWQGSRRHSTIFSSYNQGGATFVGSASGPWSYFPTSGGASFKTAPSVLLPASTWAGGEDGTGVAKGVSVGIGGVSWRRAKTASHWRRDGALGAEGADAGVGGASARSSSMPRASYFRSSTFAGGGDGRGSCGRRATHSGEVGVVGADGVESGVKRSSGGGLATFSSEVPWRSSLGGARGRTPRYISRGSGLMTCTRRHSSSTPGSPTTSSSFLGSTLLQRLQSSRATLDTSLPPSFSARTSQSPTPSAFPDQHAPSPQAHTLAGSPTHTRPSLRPHPATQTHPHPSTMTLYNTRSAPSPQHAPSPSMAGSLAQQQQQQQDPHLQPSSSCAAAATTAGLPSRGAATRAAAQRVRPLPRRSISDNAMSNRHHLHRVRFQAPSQQHLPSAASDQPLESPAFAPSHLPHALSTFPSSTSSHDYSTHTSPRSPPSGDAHSPTVMHHHGGLMHANSFPRSDPHASALTHHHGGLVHTSSLPRTNPHDPAVRHFHGGLEHSYSFPSRDPSASALTHVPPQPARVARTGSLPGRDAFASTSRDASAFALRHHHPAAVGRMHGSLLAVTEQQQQQQQQQQRPRSTYGFNVPGAYTDGLQQQQQQQRQRQRQQRGGPPSEQYALLLRQQLQRQQDQHEPVLPNQDRSWQLPTIREVSFTQTPPSASHTTPPSAAHHPHQSAQQQQEEQQRERHSSPVHNPAHNPAHTSPLPAAQHPYQSAQHQQQQEQQHEQQRSPAQDPAPDHAYTTPLPAAQHPHQHAHQQQEEQQEQHQDQGQEQRHEQGGTPLERHGDLDLGTGLARTSWDPDGSASSSSTLLPQLPERPPPSSPPH